MQALESGRRTQELAGKSNKGIGEPCLLGALKDRQHERTT